MDNKSLLVTVLTFCAVIALASLVCFAPHMSDAVDAISLSADSNDGEITILPEGKINSNGELELTDNWTVSKNFTFPDDVIFEGESKEVTTLLTKTYSMTVGSGITFTISDYNDNIKIVVDNGGKFTNKGTIENKCQIEVVEGGTFDNKEGEYNDYNTEIAQSFENAGLSLVGGYAEISNGSNVCIVMIGNSTLMMDNSSVSLIYISDCTKAEISNCHIGKGIRVDYDEGSGYEHGAAYVFGGNINFSDCSLNDLVICTEVTVTGSLSISGALIIEQGKTTGRLSANNCYIAHTGYEAVSKGAEMMGGTHFSPNSIINATKDKVTFSSDDPSGEEKYIGMWKAVLGEDAEPTTVHEYDGSPIDNGKNVIIKKIPEGWDGSVKFSIPGFDKCACIKFPEESKSISAVISIYEEKDGDDDKWYVKVIGDWEGCRLSLPYNGDIEITKHVGMEYDDDKNVFVLKNAVASCIISSFSPGPTPGPEPKPEPIVIITYSVSYDVNGGSEPIPGTVRYEEGTMAEVAPYTGYKDGYIFGGWSFNGKTYHAGDVFTVNGDMKFTAIWNALPGPEPTPSENNTGPIVGITVGIIAAVALIGGAVYFVKRK